MNKEDAFNKLRADFNNVNRPRPAIDNRHTYSVSCSWNGPIAEVGNNAGLPGCPHCGSMLFEGATSEWNQSVNDYAEKVNDIQYPVFMRWLSTRGKCSPLRCPADLVVLREEFDKLPK